MNSLSRLWWARLALWGLALLLLPAAQAQKADSVRVLRLSRAEGQVLVSHAGSDAWEEALVNFPLQEGDALATQAGLAEIEFENGATAYLAENSVLQFTQFGFAGGGKATELALTQGAGTFYANLTSQDSFRVRASTFEASIPERAQFRVDAFRDGAAVEVFLGRVTVSTGKGSASLEKGQSVAVHENDFQDLNNIARLPEEDAFDQWVNQEGEFIRSGTKNTLSYISSPNYYGLSDLSIYGNWVYLSGFGLTWRPFSAGLGWTPYVNGVWILDPRLGWIWVSNEAWGWMPYHFGSWLLSPALGWVWVPGGAAGLQRWEPECVNWVNAGGRVGWVARSPLDRGGAPANVSSGVVTRPSGSPRNANEGNVIMTGKEVQRLTVLKEPPAEFRLNLAPSGARPGITRTGLPRRAPEISNENETIVFDRGTHTFINRDGSAAENTRRAPVPPAALMPRSGPGNEAPRVTILSGAPVQPPASRVLPPPDSRAASTSRVGPPLRQAPPAPASGIAPNPTQHPGTPQGARPASPAGPLQSNPGSAASPAPLQPAPPAMPQHSSPASPGNPSGKPGSVPRLGTAP